MTRVGIKNIVSYEPQIINTSTIGSANISEFINQTSKIYGSQSIIASVDLKKDKEQ